MEVVVRIIDFDECFVRVLPCDMKEGIVGYTILGNEKLSKNGANRIKISACSSSFINIEAETFDKTKPKIENSEIKLEIKIASL